MDIPAVQFAITDDDVRIAYQDFGSGPVVVFIPTALGHLKGYWEQDHLRRMWERYAANLRLLIFDYRGNGMSDGFLEPPTLAERVLDVKAVMDTAGVERAHLGGYETGAQLAIGFATTWPERVDRLVLVNARVGEGATARAEELGPSSTITTVSDADFDRVGVIAPDIWTDSSPSLAKYPDVLAAIPRFQRLVGSRDVYRRQVASVLDIDVTDLASAVSAETLITHSTDNAGISVGYARYLAEVMPNASLIEFPGRDQMHWFQDNWRDFVDAHIRFFADAPVELPAERRLAAVLFTDIVASTSTSVATGDAAWSRTLDTHDRITDRIVTAAGGRIVKGTGDGLLATFPTPSAAITAAAQMRDELADAGVAIRAGIHAGEIEVRGDDISGSVVNLAARVEQSADDGQIWVTKAVTDMLTVPTSTSPPSGSSL